MNDKTKRVEKYTVKKLAAFEVYGFSKPQKRRDRWGTTISCLSREIAIEIELDWRELDVFVFVTSLSDGHILDGYYLSKNKKRRIHLENFLKEKCGINAAEIDNAIRKQPPRAERDEITMESLIDDYIQLVEQHISTIRARNCPIKS